MRSNRLGMYSDVKEVLDAALSHGGGVYHCADYGSAVHWRQRAYQFRKLYASLLGERKESPYDALILRRVANGEHSVRIELRSVAGVFSPAGPPLAPAPDMDEELFAAAEDFAKKIGGSDED